MTTSLPDILQESLAGRYTIERELGRGGMATVYLAEDVRHRRRVALKVVHAELSAVLGPDRFLKEIELTASLQHPHILPLFDSGRVGGHPQGAGASPDGAGGGLLYYVMPFVDGETLRERLVREGELPVDEAVRIAREVADALQYAHDRGVIHRDIKPENILLQGGHALVADFGIALAVEHAGGQRMTQTGMSLGTPQYMAPEQAMAERTLDSRTDVYALGCVLYEMLAAEPPFTGPTGRSILAKVMTEDPAPLMERRRTVPPHVDAAVMTAIEKLPADRFATARQFSEAIAGATTSRHTESKPRHVRDARGVPRLTVVMGAFLVATSALAVWGWLRRPAASATSAVTRRAVIEARGLGDVRSSAAAQITVSADGSLLAYSAPLRGTTGGLQLRRLDALDYRSIEGTSGAVGVFLSPDGQTLGFQREGDIFSVPSSGGAVTRARGTAYLSEGRPAWTPDGRIVYTTQHGGLVIVRTDGSSPDTLTRPTSGERHLSPFVLENGRTVLFTAVRADVNDARIDAFSLDDRRTRTLVTNGAMTPQVADGMLLYVRPDRALMAAPFDAQSVTVEGAAVALPDRVARTRFGVAHYAAGRGLVVYVPAAQTRLIEVGRDGRRAALSDDERTWHHPRYSADGSRIVLDLSRTDGADRDIWIFDRTTRTLSRVTRIGDAHDPTWLPNGKDVSFFSFTATGGPLFVAAADGASEPQPVRIASGFTVTDLVNPGGWLADGTTYFGGVRSRGSPSDIWRIPRDSGAPTQVVGSPAEDVSPTPSRDGRWLAYQSDETGRPEVYVRALDGSSRLQVSNAGGTEPVWDPRGFILYYVEADGDRRILMAATLRTSPAPAVVSREVVLSDIRLDESDNHPNYDIDPTGGRFVMPELGPSTGLVAIFDWAAALRDAARSPSLPSAR